MFAHLRLFRNLRELFSLHVCVKGLLDNFPWIFLLVINCFCSLVTTVLCSGPALASLCDFSCWLVCANANYYLNIHICSVCFYVCVCVCVLMLMFVWGSERNILFTQKINIGVVLIFHIHHQHTQINGFVGWGGKT